MVADFYRKIEKRIVGMKEREELWKARYKEVAQQLKELMDSNSKQIKSMDQRLEEFGSRMEIAENAIKRNDERAAETFRLAEKRLADISEKINPLSLRIEEQAKDIKDVRSEVTSHVNSIIAKHEKTFDGVIQKINLAVSRLPDPPPQIIPMPAVQPAPRAPYIPPVPQAPLPGELLRGQDFQGQQEPPFIYDPASAPPAPAFSTEGASRRLPASGMRRKPVLLDDDDLDMDDDLILPPIAGQADFANSVSTMNNHVSTITEKLAAIEEKVARMQSYRDPGVDRIEDKISMYSQSVADVQARMQTVEKAIRDGMTPMVESLDMLTQTVKSLKEEARPSIARPSPPAERDFQKRGSLQRPESPRSQFHLQPKPPISPGKSNAVFNYKYREVGKEV